MKQRLAETERALLRDADADPAHRREVLQARAQAMAAARPPAPVAGEGIEVVEFTLAERRCAIECAVVREVQSLKELTGVPCTPPFVSGIINAHGRILAVIDLQKFLKLAESGLTDLNKVIILQHGDLEFGILADRIVGTYWLPLTDLQAVEPALDMARAPCVRGLTDRQVLVLDGQRLIADAALVVDDEVSP
ncbi:MAG TPA: chemotaxis protein CheW [Albitalea sp.]|uniref:chemotaxis protein CheW n=1 Tax=Piscinibacter sp. TaxID=1903157 RepID=UPI002ED19206